MVLVGDSVSAFVLAPRFLAGGITPECDRICMNDAIARPWLVILLAEVMRPIEEGNIVAWNSVLCYPQWNSFSGSNAEQRAAIDQREQLHVSSTNV